MASVDPFRWICTHVDLYHGTKRFLLGSPPEDHACLKSDFQDMHETGAAYTLQGNRLIVHAVINSVIWHIDLRRALTSPVRRAACAASVAAGRLLFR